MRSDVDMQVRGWRLTTAEIIYHLPDHPGILQSFVWQLLDHPPHFPRLHKFLDYWAHNIEGTLHSVHIAHAGLVTPGKMRPAEVSLELH